MVEQTKQTRPTVVVLGYGMASSLEDAAAIEMEGRALRVPDSTSNRTFAQEMGTRGTRPSKGLDKFVRDYNSLIDAILDLNKEVRFNLVHSSSGEINFSVGK